MFKIVNIISIILIVIGNILYFKKKPNYSIFEAYYTSVYLIICINAAVLGVKLAEKNNTGNS